MIFMLALLAAPWSVPGQEKDVCRPVLDSPWSTLFAPRIEGNYLNDHTVFQDPEGDWHAIGISSRHGNILHEVYFAHGVTHSLDEPMRELERLFDGYPDDKRKYAPHVFKEGDTYHLYAGPADIRHYVSKDGYDWEYKGIAIKADWSGLRDTMVIKLDDGTFLQYACDGNKVSVWESSDLYNWSNKRVVFRVAFPAPVWPFGNPGSAESPFVIKYRDYYYLSVCITNYPLFLNSYNNTIIVRSKDPRDFGLYTAGTKKQTAEHVATIKAHCSEYIQDEDGTWYITSGGWRRFPVHKGKKHGTAAIAKLRWEGDCGPCRWVETSRREGGRLLLRSEDGEETRWIKIYKGSEPRLLKREIKGGEVTWMEVEKDGRPVLLRREQHGDKVIWVEGDAEE